MSHIFVKSICKLGLFWN